MKPIKLNDSVYKKMGNTSKMNFSMDYRPCLQLPQTECAKDHLWYLDMGFKVQILLQDFTNIVYWSSVVDIFLFIFTLSCFMTSAKEAGSLFLHIFHVLRAFNGGFIVFKFPKSSKIIDDVKAHMQPMNHSPVEH